MKLLTLMLAAVIGTAHNSDIIPDFSRVGYHYGDREIPELPVKAEITQKSLKKGIRQCGDTTAYIQSVIDKVGRSGGGAVLLSAGTYNVGRILFIDRDNVVLRGAGEGRTIIRATGTAQRPVIALGRTTAPTGAKHETVQDGRALIVDKHRTSGAGGRSSYGKVFLFLYHVEPVEPVVHGEKGVEVAEDYVPVGRLYLKVRDASQFRAGQHIMLRMPHSPAWISAIGMDRIAHNGRENSKTKGGTIQWTDRDFTMNWSRIITAVEGDTLWLDAPVVMALDRRFGESLVIPYEPARISESGVENLTIESTYNPEIIKGKDQVDEAHAWTAIEVNSAAHCWVRNVTSKHMGYGLVDIRRYARNISVLDCTSLEPVSLVSGARRYAFCITRGGELCLFKNCRCDNDRHAFVTNGMVCGPNVFTQCSGTKMRESIGPHQSWATGCLFDRIEADGRLEVEDRGNFGTGHGWSGANFVLWNCGMSGAKSRIVCQSPWGAGKNYCVGTTGVKHPGRKYDRDYYGKEVEDWFVKERGLGPSGENRPDGEWYPAVAYGGSAPGHVSLPASDVPAWWPVFAVSQFGDPLSLYECQKQSRSAQGIDLGDLK